MPSLKAVTIDLAEYLPHACHCALLQNLFQQTMSSLCSRIRSSHNASHRVCASLGVSATIICISHTDCNYIQTMFQGHVECRVDKSASGFIPSNANPRRIFCGSAANSGHVSLICFQALESNRDRTIPSVLPFAKCHCIS